MEKKIASLLPLFFFFFSFFFFFFFLLSARFHSNADLPPYAFLAEPFVACGDILSIPIRADAPIARVIRIFSFRQPASVETSSSHAARAHTTLSLAIPVHRARAATCCSAHVRNYANHALRAQLHLQVPFCYVYPWIMNDRCTAQVRVPSLSIEQFRHGHYHAQPSLPPPSSAARHPCGRAASPRDRPPTSALRQRDAVPRDAGYLLPAAHLRPAGASRSAMFICKSASRTTTWTTSRATS